MTVDIMSPDARKKVDELFLYWLSEPSTQDLLRHEVAKVCGLQQQKAEQLLSPTANKRLRPASPTVRAITPPLPSVPSPTLSPSLSRSSKAKNVHLQSSICSKQTIDSGEHLANGTIPARNEPHDKDEVDTPVIVPAITTKTAAEPSFSKSKVPSIVVPEETIPRFYFPNGRPEKGKKREMEKIMVNVGRVFERYPRQEVPRGDFHLVVKVSNHFFKLYLSSCCKCVS